MKCEISLILRDEEVSARQLIDVTKQSDFVYILTDDVVWEGTYTANGYKLWLEGEELGREMFGTSYFTFNGTFTLTQKEQK